MLEIIPDALSRGPRAESGKLRRVQGPLGPGVVCTNPDFGLFYSLCFGVDREISDRRPEVLVPLVHVAYFELGVLLVLKWLSFFVEEGIEILRVVKKCAFFKNSIVKFLLDDLLPDRGQVTGTHFLKCGDF